MTTKELIKSLEQEIARSEKEIELAKADGNDRLKYYWKGQEVALEWAHGLLEIAVKYRDIK